MDIARTRERAIGLLRNTVSPVNRTNFAVAVLLTTVAAVTGTITSEVLKEPWTAIVLAVLGLGLLLAIGERTRVRRATGTIFHVQVLDEAMADLRAAGRDSAEERRMSVRSVVRRVDWESRTTGGVIDAVDVTRDVRSALEIQLNADAPETGYALAPVLPWPMGVALGTELPLPRVLRLVELAGGGLAATSIPLASRAHTPTDCPKITDDPSGRVGVLLGITGEAQQYLDDTGLIDALWRECCVTTSYRVTTTDGRAHSRHNPLTPAHLDGLGRSIAERLATIKKDHPGQELVVAGFVTKTLSLTIGWHLVQQECRFFHGTHLLNWHGGRFVPMRVRDSQPTHAPAPAPAGAHA